MKDCIEYIHWRHSWLGSCSIICQYLESEILFKFKLVLLLSIQSLDSQANKCERVHVCTWYLVNILLCHFCIPPPLISLFLSLPLHYYYYVTNCFINIYQYWQTYSPHFTHLIINEHAIDFPCDQRLICDDCVKA